MMLAAAGHLLLDPDGSTAVNSSTAAALGQSTSPTLNSTITPTTTNQTATSPDDASIPPYINDSDLDLVLNVTRDYPFHYATIMFGYIMPFVLIITLITNTLVVMVLAQRHMRTPTNIVLFTMAIVDLMTLLSPSPWYFYIYTLGFHDKFLYPPSACYAFHIMTDVIPVFFHTSSIWLALLLASQRYIYVCHPTMARTWCTVPRVKEAIIIILVVAFIHQLSRFFDNTFMPVSVRTGTGAIELACKYDTAQWVLKVDIVSYYMTYYTFRILFVFIIPCTALILLNYLLFGALRKAENKRTELLRSRFKLVGKNHDKSHARHHNHHAHLHHQVRMEQCSESAIGPAKEINSHVLDVDSTEQNGGGERKFIGADLPLENQLNGGGGASSQARRQTANSRADQRHNNHSRNHTSTLALTSDSIGDTATATSIPPATTTTITTPNNFSRVLTSEESNDNDCDEVGGGGGDRVRGGARPRGITEKSLANFDGRVLTNLIDCSSSKCLKKDAERAAAGRMVETGEEKTNDSIDSSEDAKYKDDRPAHGEPTDVNDDDDHDGDNDDDDDDVAADEEEEDGDETSCAECAANFEASQSDLKDLSCTCQRCFMSWSEGQLLCDKTAASNRPASHHSHAHQLVSQCSSSLGGIATTATTTTNEDISSCYITQNASSSALANRDATIDGVDSVSLDEGANVICGSDSHTKYRDFRSVGYGERATKHKSDNNEPNRVAESTLNGLKVARCSSVDSKIAVCGCLTSAAADSTRPRRHRFHLLRNFRTNSMKSAKNSEANDKQKYGREKVCPKTCDQAIKNDCCKSAGCRSQVRNIKEMPDLSSECDKRREPARAEHELSCLSKTVSSNSEPCAGCFGAEEIDDDRNCQYVATGTKRKEKMKSRALSRTKAEICSISFSDECCDSIDRDDSELAKEQAAPKSKVKQTMITMVRARVSSQPARLELQSDLNRSSSPQQSVGTNKSNLAGARHKMSQIIRLKGQSIANSARGSRATLIFNRYTKPASKSRAVSSGADSKLPNSTTTSTNLPLIVASQTVGSSSNIEKSAPAAPAAQSIASSRTMDSNRTTLMLIVVVTVFLMVEVPVAIVTILHVIMNLFGAFESPGFAMGLDYIKLFTNFFIMISYSVNFTIYCSMSKKFRETFRDLFLCGKSAKMKRAQRCLMYQNQQSQYNFPSQITQTNYITPATASQRAQSSLESRLADNRNNRSTTLLTGCSGSASNLNTNSPIQGATNGEQENRLT